MATQIRRVGNYHQQITEKSGPGHDDPASMMPYSPQPGSPTLTNPDMILPEDGRASSPDRSQSPLFMWKGLVTINDMQYHMPLHNAYTAGPVTPITPIIYGNGTMLSDIGEVTEVESNVGGSSRRSTQGPVYSSANDVALRSSPTMGAADGESSTAPTIRTIIKKRLKTATHERKDSIDSNSTVTTQDRAGLFADFVDTASVDDSVFQGDDEESVAESFADDASVQSTRPRTTANGSGLNDENRFSTSSIGRRAELILANAKKRLNTMEGNLSRARSSLYIHPALSSGGSMSAPSPPMPTLDGALSDPNLMSSRFGHSRVPSDDLIHSDSSPPGTFPPRSASALGAAGGYRQPLTGSKSVDALKLDLGRPRTSLPAPDRSLEPLSEDEPQSGLESAQADGLLSPTFGSDKPTSRPGSAAQMRELKEQMSGLKGRISNLREQAKADSMKRRSLQTLRTSSPFTNAPVDQWYDEPAKSEPSSAFATSPWNGEIPSREGAADNVPYDVNAQDPDPVPEEDESNFSEYELATEDLPAASGLDQDEHRILEQADEEDDLRTEDGFDPDDPIHDGIQDEQESIDDASESGDSLYHDTYQTPVSHEDREDAFDYEHFFLHSAMGTLSQEHLGRRSSFSSEDSVETTKGPIVTPEEVERTRHHSRRGSGDTVSTMDTFATAEEQRYGTYSRTSISSYHEISNGDTDEAEPEPGSQAESLTEPNSHASFDSPGYEAYISNVRARRRHNSVLYRPTSIRASTLHRPSVSSFESTGTNRSFPLVNGKLKMNGVGVLTPQGSPDEELKNVSDALMSEATSASGKDGDSPAIQALDRDDQILVQRLVAGLGRCVLGLGEAGRASAEGRMYRRRLHEARRLLEGLEAPLE